jgi:hypothetical protein
MSDRNGIEIDYCPQCRGVWLDRGELDKIIERSMQYEQNQPAMPPQPTYPAAQPPVQAPNQPPQSPYDPNYRRYDDDYDDDYYKRHGKHKRKSFLGDMFDIFD